MKHPCLLLIPLLLTLSSGQEDDFLPRGGNFVSNYLSKMLDKFYNELMTSKLAIPEINLGEETGKFTQVEISLPGKVEKFVDGVHSFGFKLNTTLTRVLIEGNYDVLYLNVPGLFPFFGKGKFCVTLDMVNLDMKLLAEYTSSADKFNIDIPDFQVLVQNSTVKFNDLMNDTHLADFLNELLSKLLPDVVKTLSKPLIEVAKPLVDYFGNGIILCIKRGILNNTTEKCIKDLFFQSLIMKDGFKLSVDFEKIFNFAS